MGSNTWRKFTNAFFSFQRSDRNAIRILSLLIFVVVVANYWQKNREPVSDSNFSEMEKLFSMWDSMAAAPLLVETLDLFDFDPNTISDQQLDSLALPEMVKQNLIKYRMAGGKFVIPNDIRKIYGMNDSVFARIEKHIHIFNTIPKSIPVASEPHAEEPSGIFDPNKATVQELEYFGFSRYQAKNLVNYRSKGAVFVNPGDIIRVYGVDSALFKQVKKYMVIEPGKIKSSQPSIAFDSIELNSADSAALIKLSGIGPYYANGIIKYRNLLGGYYSKNQLMEVYNFKEETFAKIQSLVFVDTLHIKKIRLNFAEYKELLRHPYLNKEQVNELVKVREEEGALNNISELYSLKFFDAETIKKISPYITCH